MALLVNRSQQMFAVIAIHLLKGFAGKSSREIAMRILFHGLVHPTNLAKSLKRALSAFGHEIGIRTCEEHIARMTGYLNWHELRTVSMRQPEPSPNDHEMGSEIASIRRQQYIDALAPIYGTAIADALVSVIRPTGVLPKIQMFGNATLESTLTVPSRDGWYPFAFAHRVTTTQGQVLVRSFGRVRIPYAKPTRIFAGEFFLPKASEIPRPATTRLDLHAVEGALYSRVAPILNSRLPEDFGRADTLLDTLLWKKEPSGGVSGHPLGQALNVGFSATRLNENICPPNWSVHYGRDRDPHHHHAPLYGGTTMFARHGLSAYGHLDAILETPPPAIMTELALRAEGLTVLSNDRDRLGDAIAKAVDGNLALVGDAIMIRTPEPCWRLTLTKGGDLRLDLIIWKKIWVHGPLDPALFFALDEVEALDRAVEAMLATAEIPRLRRRGRLDHFEPGACTIDGHALRFQYLAECLHQAIPHAAKLLPLEVARAAEELQKQLPGKESCVNFSKRSNPGKGVPSDLIATWTDLKKAAGSILSPSSEKPWLARLAKHGLVLEHIMTNRSINA